MVHKKGLDPAGLAGSAGQPGQPALHSRRERGSGHCQVGGLPQCTATYTQPYSLELYPWMTFCTFRMGSQGPPCVALGCMMGKLRPRESENETHPL